MFKSGKTKLSFSSRQERNNENSNINIIKVKDKDDINNKTNYYPKIKNELPKNTSSQLKLFNETKIYELLNLKKKICRICLEKGDKNAPLIAPCLCEGSIKYVHQSCLKKWLIKSKIRPELSRCEICKDKYYIRYYKDKKIDKNAYKRFVLYIFCLIIGMVFILCFFIICLYHVVFDEKNIKKKTKIIYFIISIFISIIVLSTSSLIVICCFRKKCSEKVFENFEIIDKSYYDCSSISKTISKHIGSIKNIQINNFVLK